MIDKGEKQVEASDQKKKKNNGFWITRKYILGVITGVLLTTVMVLGSNMALNSNLLSGTSTEISHYELEYLPVVTNFEKEVLESDEPVLVYFTMDGNDHFSKSLVNVYNLNYNVAIKKFIIEPGKFYDNYYEMPFRSDTREEEYSSVALYYDGKMLGSKYLIISNWEIFDWVNSYSNVVIGTKPTPIPVPNVPTIYRAFPKTVNANLNPPEIGYVSEIILNPYDHALNNTYQCKKGVSSLVSEYSALYSLLGNTYGGNEVQFGIPDLSSYIPIEGLQYYIMTNGNYPENYGKTAISVDEINYIPTDEIPDEIFLGQIILAKDIDKSRRYDSILPCDGRNLSVSQNQILFSLLGNKFGGDGINLFNLPDMSGLSPIEGAKYYIVIDGIYPGWE